MAKPRDYAREAAYEATEEQKHNRALRNKARRAALRKGLVHKGDDKDVGHVKALSRGGSGDLSNTKIQSRTSNRSFARNPDGSMKSERSKRGK